jgi:HKD family nuclease
LVLANYTSEIIKKSLDHLKDSHKSVGEQITFINKLISKIIQETGNNDFSKMSVDERAEQLLALVENKNRLPQNTAKTDLSRPVTSIAFSSLFTGAKNEPDLSSEFIKEIASSDRIDILVSFIRWSGLRLIINELKDFTINGGKLRVITTSYMGATDLKAVVELSKLPNTEIRVSYDTKRTRLHAKTYIFVRETGFTTAYVGSSNLSNAAMSSGLEWNIKVAKKDMPGTIDKINATFESYWNSNEFEMYSENDRNKLAASLKSERISGNAFDGQYYFDISPYPFQQEILKQDRKSVV